nr:unnamed protein product [Haemonchus contortus]
MHLCTVFLIYCFLMVAQGNAEDPRCAKNVPPSVQKTIINVVNAKCFKGKEKKLDDDSYDCELGRKASIGEQTGTSQIDSIAHFGGKSSFEFDWEKSLTGAVYAADTESMDFGEHGRTRAESTLQLQGVAVLLCLPDK